MTVRIFAIVLELLGVLLIIIGGQGDSPVGLVGPALMLLSGILLFTPRSNGR
jgi:threonine/homoserine efflux transporter RhtA